MYLLRTAMITYLLLALMAHGLAWSDEPVSSLPGTEPLTWQDDIASRLVAGADRFLLSKLQASRDGRATFWHRDKSSPAAYAESVRGNRERLAHILGVRDERSPLTAFDLVATVHEPALIGESERVQVYAVRWPVLRRLTGEGLLLVPKSPGPVADVIAWPDAAQTPEMICGLVAGVPPESQYALRLAEQGCRVLVPCVVDRQFRARRGRAEVTNREFLYRSAYELGRHLIGYEVQKGLAAVDWFTQEAGEGDPRIAVVGWGEGGMLALYMAALDPRIDAACVSGYFQPRESIWEQPIDRNVFGLLEQFGDAELASLVAPRPLLIEAARGPELELPSRGGAPAVLRTPELESVQAEFARARGLVAGLTPAPTLELLVSADGQGPYLTEGTLQAVLKSVSAAGSTAFVAPAAWQTVVPVDGAARAERQMMEIDDFNQWLLRESAYVRADFMKTLDTSSPTAYAKTSAQFRNIFRQDVIGWFDDPLLAPAPRTRQAYDHEKWTGYEVVLDVFPEVIAYGILLIPKGLQPNERRPVVVCQHGLEGRPQDVVAGGHRAYHDFAAQLAERGFITFAPQNLYLFGDRFRTLQRKANPLKKTLFSLIVPQHQQILNWLKTLPNVDGDRIAFYGLSYGGKSAMRIPALLEDYCLSICSADFNEWVWKNASTRAPYSYVWTGEYEIFEFDLGSTFNYAEMAALIAPRPFMVERGHFDGVAPDEKVAHEFAKVRHLYQARLNLPDRCAIEWFVGPHTINGQGTFEFLHRHLNWPRP